MHHRDKGKHLLWKAGLTILPGKVVVVDKITTKTSERKQNNGLFTMTSISKKCVQILLCMLQKQPFKTIFC